MKQYEIKRGVWTGNVIESDETLEDYTRIPIPDESKTYEFAGNRWVESPMLLERTRLKNEVRLLANAIRDQVSESPITITLQSGESATFRVDGGAFNDISDSSRDDAAGDFPMLWLCDNGAFTVTHTDIKNVRLAYRARRKSLVESCSVIKNEELTIEEMLQYLQTPYIDHISEEPITNNNILTKGYALLGKLRDLFRR